MTSIAPPSSPVSSDDDAPELSKAERIEQAYAAYKHPDNTLSITKIANRHGIWPSTLHYRLTHGPSMRQRIENLQRLTPEEETILVKYIIRLQAWGWPA